MAAMGNLERAKPIPVQPELHPLMEGIETVKQFQISDELARLLQGLPEASATSDLLFGMNQTTLAGKVLSILAIDHPRLKELALLKLPQTVNPPTQAIEITVGGKRKNIGGEVKELLALARGKLQGSGPMDSGHLLQVLASQGELNRRGLLDDTKLRPESVGAVFDHVAQGVREKGMYDIGKQSHSLEFQAQDLFPDLLEKARQKRLAQVFVPKDWVVNSLNMLISGDRRLVLPLCELESELLAYRLAYDLTLSNDKFGIRHLMFVSRNDWITSGEKNIETLIKNNQSSVVVMPFVEDPQSRRNLQRAAISNRVKLLMYDKEELVDNEGIERLFLDNPTDEEMMKMFEPLKQEYERQFGFTIDAKGLREAVRLGQRYSGLINQGIRPVEAVDFLLRQAASAIRLTAASVPSLQKLMMVKNDGKIHDTDLRYALQKLTGVEVQPENRDKFRNMEADLNGGVIGQEEAVSAVSNAVKRAKAGFSDPKKPIGSFMFLGPSGVGKTELGKKLAELLFDSEDELITVNMSEFGDASSRTRLIGAPPGYVGYEEAGQLTEQVRRRPYSVVMFDEIEKAHPDVLVVLLQMMDEGKLTDGQGRVIDFRNTVIIMTGNVGSHHYEKYNELGKTIVERKVREELKSGGKFRPEFLNRLTQIVVFNPLGMTELAQIAPIQIRKKNKELAANGLGVEISLSPTVIRRLATIASEEPMNGARPLLRELDKQIYQVMTNLVFTNMLKRGNVVEFDLEDGKMVHRIVKKSAQKK